MSRKFGWQPSECEDMPAEDLLDYFHDAQNYLRIETEARAASIRSA